MRRATSVACAVLLGCGESTTGDDGGGDGDGSSGGDGATMSASAASADPTGGPASSGMMTSADATGSSSSDPDSSDASTGAPTVFTCTHVIGFSQTREWFQDGATFETVVDDDRWQLRWNGGAGVDQWRNADYEGWNQPIQSPCAAASDAPDRVLLTISGPYGMDETAWAEAIEETIERIRENHPSATEIALQPVVGGPGHATCTNGNQDVRASWQHAHIDNAIAMVVAGDVVAEASPEVADCSEYEDSLGHLSDPGAAAAGQTLGEYYAD